MKKQKHTDETLETKQETVENETIETPQQEEITENTDVTAQQIEELTQKCADLNDKNLRLMAEFDNYRKRTLKERMDLIKTAGESLLSNMLPLVDDFERGLKAMETSEDVVAVKEGVDLIYNKFVAFLMQNGVK
ncbi:nucleotide exchange factor GrpE, partial [bacterium]|nr:nucleotide exchange factor GrpE [bacterium]